MNGIFIGPVSRAQGEVRVPGDKSISHRAALFGGMAVGETHIMNFLPGQDCLSTLRCLSGLGVKWERNGAEVWVYGEGMESWQEPFDVLDVGNSGTTIRLMLGALAGSPFAITFTGDSSIRTRPMRRVTEPLRQMGAQIVGRQGGNLLPLTLTGGDLVGGDFQTSVPSAQVKSAIILAGLRAKGKTTVTEPALSRDHSERMLRGFGADIHSEGTKVTVAGGGILRGQEISVPGDISSAAFFLVLGSLIKSGEIVIRDVGLNPTRTGIIDALRMMGADIEEFGFAEICGEPRASLRVRPAALHGIEIGGELIPRLIDEIPVLAVAASLAQGETVIRDAAELRVKETDRITTVAEGLTALGADVQELPDGLVIKGKPKVPGGRVSSNGDHRLAMAFAVAGVVSADGVSIDGAEAVEISYPEFFRALEQITL